MESTTGLDAREVWRVLMALEEVGLRVWVAGGWGVDALVGRQTRPHRDVDLLLDHTEIPMERSLEVLGTLGYVIETDWRPSRIEVAAPDERWVDLHPLTFDDHGTGWQSGVEGGPPFRYPPAAFGAGSIAGAPVRCLSVEQQLVFHRGYPPRPHDLADIALLEALPASTDRPPFTGSG